MDKDKEKITTDKLYADFKSRLEEEKRVIDLEKSNKKKDDLIKSYDTRIKELEKKPAVIKPDLTPSGIEVGEPSEYKGFAFRAQGQDSKYLSKATPKVRSSIVRSTIDIFAPHSQDETIQKAVKADLKKATLASGVAGSVAEYALPDDHIRTIIDYAREESVILAKARRFPVASGKIYIPVRGNNANTTWSDEGVASDRSEPTSATETVETHQLGVWGVINQVLLNRQMVDIVSYINDGLIEDIASVVDVQGFTGDGTYMTGIMPNATHNFNFGASSSGPGSSNTWNGMTARDFYKSRQKLTQKQRKNAEWYLSNEALEPVFDIEDSAGRKIYRDLGAADQNTIAAYKYNEVPFMAGTDATSTNFICFTNLSYYALGVETFNTTIELNPYAGDEFKKRQVLYRMYVDIGGAPLYDSLSVVLSTA